VGDLLGATLIIDAGHGGRDPGALGEGPVPEKTVNLGVTSRLVNLLRARGATVITTRNSDRFIELDDRAALADQHRVDLFISIHADSCPRPSVTGSTLYIARNAVRESERAAERIAAALKRAGIECRGIRRAGFRVLVGHSRPAVLVECGYLSNPGEAKRLSTASYQTRLAEALADGIANHLAR
jgi:N-acetylmuramoyl-L-alanine amidase